MKTHRRHNLWSWQRLVGLGAVLLAPALAIPGPAKATDASGALTVGTTETRTVTVNDLLPGFVPNSLTSEDVSGRVISAYSLAPGAVPGALVLHALGADTSGLNPAKVAWIRNLLPKSGQILGRLNKQEHLNATRDNASKQAAVWEILGTSPLASVQDKIVRRHATALIRYSAIASTFSSADSYEHTAITVDAEPRPQADTDLTVDISLKDQRIPPGGRAERSIGLPSETVTFAARGVPAVAAITGQDGSTSLTIPLPARDTDFVASWSGVEPPGMIFGDGETKVIAVEGIPVTRRSPAVKVQALSGASAGISAGAVNSAASRMASSWAGRFILVLALVGLAVAAVASVGASTATSYLQKSSRMAVKWMTVTLVLGIFTFGYYFMTSDPVKQERAIPRSPTPPASLAAGVQDLVPTRWGGTSSYPNDGYDHSPGCAFDADEGGAATAWVSAPGLGIIQSLVVQFDQPVWVAGLVLRNGNQRTPESFADNGKVTSLQVLGDDGYFRDINKIDPGTLAEQNFSFEPMLTSHLTVRVMSVDEGWNSSAITRLLFRGSDAGISASRQYAEAHPNGATSPNFQAISKAELGAPCRSPGAATSSLNRLSEVPRSAAEAKAVAAFLATGVQVLHLPVNDAAATVNCQVLLVYGADLVHGDLDATFVYSTGGQCGGDPAGTDYQIRGGLVTATADACGDCNSLELQGLNWDKKYSLRQPAQFLVRVGENAALTLSPQVSVK